MDAANKIPLSSGVVHPGQGYADCGGQRVKLTTKECALIRYLASRPHQLITREEILIDVWGYAEDVVTRAVDTAMSRLRSKVESNPAEPKHLITVYGEGYRFEPLSEDDAETVAVAKADTPPRLEDPDAFIGRRQELDSLIALLKTETRIITLLGTGGVGKTRLARELMNQPGVPFPGDGWMFDLSAAHDVDGIVRAVAQGLDVPLGAEDPIVQLGYALDALGPTLVVFDNFEQVVALARTTLVPWMRLASNARFVCTSRIRLDVPGEHVVAIEPLPPEEAVELFTQKGRRGRPSFAVTDENRATITRIVDALDRLPLAIHLAAARLPVMSESELLERLSNRMQLLRDRTDELPARQATMQAAIDWSWKLLDVPAQQTMTQCSVFAGGFTLEAAEAVVDLGALPDAPWVVDVIQTLLESSLLSVDDAPGSQHRYRMFESIRDHAAAQLADRAETERRHASYYAQWASPRHRAALHALGGTPLRQRRNLDLNNLMTAAGRATKAGWADLAARVGLAAMDLLAFTGPFEMATRVGTAVVDLEGGSAEDRVGLQHALATAYLWTGEIDRAGEMARAGLDAATDLGDASLIGQLTTAMGRWHLARGELSTARDVCERATTLHRQTDDRMRLGSALEELGRVQYSMGDLEASQSTFKAAMALHREVGNRAGEAIVMCSLANGASCLGRKSAARGMFRAALAVTQEIGDKRAEGSVRMNTGVLELELGRYVEAHRAISAAGDIHLAMGNHTAMGWVRSNLGVIELERGELDAAQAHLEDALAIHRMAEDRNRASAVITNLATVHRLRGTLTEALAHAEEAMRIKVEVGDCRGEGIAQGNLGDLLMDMGNTAEATEHLQRAIAVLDDTLPEAAGSFRGSLALLLAREGDFDAAARLFERGAQQLRGIHHVEYAGLTCKRGEAALLAGDRNAAVAALAEARPLYVEAGSHPKSELAVLLGSLERGVSD